MEKNGWKLEGGTSGKVLIKQRERAQRYKSKGIQAIESFLFLRKRTNECSVDVWI